MNRRLARWSGALGLLVGLIAYAAPASSVQAVGACSARAMLPARIQLDRVNVLTPVPLAVSCPDAASFAFNADLYGPGGTQDFLLYSQSQLSSTVDTYSYGLVPGTYQTVLDDNSFALDANSNPISVQWASTSVSIKYASYAYIAVQRQGRAVYVNGLIKQWEDFNPARSAGRAVYLQRYIGGAWQTVLVRTSNATGQISVGFIQPAVVQYRLVVTETGSAFNSYSGSGFV